MKQYIISIVYKSGQVRFFSPTAVSPWEALQKVGVNNSLKIRDIESFKIEEGNTV